MFNSTKNGDNVNVLVFKTACAKQSLGCVFGTSGGR